MSNLERLHIFPEILSLDPPGLHPSFNELIHLSSQLEKLSLDIHTVFKRRNRARKASKIKF